MDEDPTDNLVAPPDTCLSRAPKEIWRHIPNQEHPRKRYGHKWPRNPTTVPMSTDLSLPRWTLHWGLVEWVASDPLYARLGCLLAELRSFWYYASFLSLTSLLIQNAMFLNHEAFIACLTDIAVLSPVWSWFKRNEWARFLHCLLVRPL